jgi:SAM-dependent methyltransferase
MENFYEINRQSWNLKTRIHRKSDFYDLAGFKAGDLSLKEIELEEVGDVNGKSLIHLQCHFGLDTLSWARLGANVTGVDISDESIATAQALADELNLDATFVRSNVYDVPEIINDTFDIVYVSYGAVNWLDSIEAWARIVASLLKPGGAFHLIEFHPVNFSMGSKGCIEDSYFNTPEPVDTLSEVTYAGENKVPHRTIEWNHSLSEIINALIASGLELKYLNEFPYQVYDCFPDMMEIAPGRWVYKAIGPRIPYMYSLKAVKLKGSSKKR